MNFKTLTISGFKSFRQTTVVDLSPSGKFILILGDNKVEPQLGANGAGKSTVWDALCWVLYGKTARGLKSSNVVSWDKKSCFVEVTGSFGILRREQAPNNLILNGKAVTQDYLDTVLGLSYEEFLNSVLLGQFNLYFLDLSPAEKLSVFTQLLNLNRWQDYSEMARLGSVEKISELHKLELEVAKMKGTLGTIREYIKQNKVSLKKIPCMNTKRHTELAALLQNTQKRIDVLREWKHQVASTQKKLTASRMDFTQKVTRAQTELRYSTIELNKCKSDICPTCGQSWRGFEKKRSELTVSASKLNKRLCEWTEELEKVDKQLGALEINDRDNERETKELVSDLTMYKQEYQSEQDKKRACQEIKRVLDEQRRSRDLLKADLERYAQKISDVTQVRDYYLFWAKEFKLIRLWMVDTCLRELEIETNNALTLLGLSDWTLRFDIERETKAGTVSRGFSVFVSAPEVSGEVPFECWSGGETQRLRLAGAMGLSALIQSRRGIQCNLEVWDEPTAHLSAQGIVDLLDCLKERSQAGNRSVWLIDHKSLEYGEFDLTYCITKKDQVGSVIERC